MTDTPRTPPPTAAAHHRHPFTLDPGRWEAEHARAVRTGHVRDHTCTAECEPVLVYERTRWGWLAWTVPGDGSRPELPHQIGVLTPSATRTQRLALRWLTRRPALRIGLAPTIPGSLRFSTLTVAAISVFAGLFAMIHGVPADVALPAMALAPLLAEHLPSTLDAGAREHVRSVEGISACRYLQRLAALHTYLVQAAAVSDCYELRRSAEIGQHLLWDAADLLQTHDNPSASCELIVREHLMLQLAHQVAQILKYPFAQSATADADQARTTEPPPLPYQQTPQHPPGTSPPKGTLPMPQPNPAARTSNVYLLFAHEPYYPGPGTQEINTTVVAADTLLHPQVLQPDGIRIHDLLTGERQPGEIIPLATLTHELNGGSDWLAVGDWERVTADLVQLVQTQRCDALSLGLPEVARALICTGPDSQVRAFDAAAGGLTVYGPDDRTKVLTEVGMFLTGIAAEQPFWPGDGLLPPLSQSACARRGRGAGR
ncbi:hypothetical protein ACIPSA_49690 [Streptomyces sp. NPDC086549]|uniref:hypothetical protein n=1 Tax=Streptomyces sp. NPDC086549 TaxID=3365752 RepID=UPI00381A278B